MGTVITFDLYADTAIAGGRPLCAHLRPVRRHFSSVSMRPSAHGKTAVPSQSTATRPGHPLDELPDDVARVLEACATGRELSAGPASTPGRCRVASIPPAMSRDGRHNAALDPWSGRCCPRRARQRWPGTSQTYRGRAVAQGPFRIGVVDPPSRAASRLAAVVEVDGGDRNLGHLRARRAPRRSAYRPVHVPAPRASERDRARPRPRRRDGDRGSLSPGYRA